MGSFLVNNTCLSGGQLLLLQWSETLRNTYASLLVAPAQISTSSSHSRTVFLTQLESEHFKLFTTSTE